MKKPTAEERLEAMRAYWDGLEIQAGREPTGKPRTTAEAVLELTVAVKALLREIPLVRRLPQLRASSE